jgi:hypothetical protein
VEIEFDPSKSEENAARRGLPFSLVSEFEFDTALIGEDIREGYGETGFIAVGFLGARLHIVAYTMRGTRLRVISFRKANRREVARYEQAQS